MKLPESKLVAWSLVGTTVVLTVGGAARGAFPGVRQFVALAVVYIILGFGNEVAPQIMGPLAVLVFLAVLLQQGSGLFDALPIITGGESNKAHHPSNVIRLRAPRGSRVRLTK